MKLIIYKGFDHNFLSQLSMKPLVENDVKEKQNAINFDRGTRRELERRLLDMEDTQEFWVTYEEYSLIKNRVDEAVWEDGLELLIYRNNLYPDYYPLAFSVDDELVNEIEKTLHSNTIQKESERCQRYLKIYNDLVNVNGTYYSSFYNYEYDNKNIKVIEYYDHQISVEEGKERPDLDIFINGDVNTYLKDLSRIEEIKPSVIGVKRTGSEISKRILLSLKTYCVAHKIRLVQFYEEIIENSVMDQELMEIARNDIHISNFVEFRKLKFYKNPDIDKEVIDIPQSALIREIICQAEKSYNSSGEQGFRDIFITASTGAGKSIMFQIPAVYLAKHYKKLTIVVEPVKALMQDQKDKLMRNGYTRVEVFNSDLISKVEKEAVLKRIKGGEVDLLYLSPETLLSYSIDTIIGDREIGLLIIDEAHIVTTWGMGFRPDYWYLGGYINRLRNQIQTIAGKARKIYNFPICAFTATVISGGLDDSVGETITSLYMENPVKFIGYVKRDDISFDIKICENRKLPKEEYETKKTEAMTARINEWLAQNEKTIAYFPYATDAKDASRGVMEFAGIKTDPKIGVYTGKNVDEVSREMQSEQKKEMFDKFRSGEKLIMYATKAFGMGVDINDVKNVYHYAVSGNLCDYIQEIGRAARKTDMTGVAEMDYFYNDMMYMRSLFGISQIRQYQVKKVIEEIYDVWKSKKGARSFLISPQAFTYIFNGKGIKDEEKCINKLKTCLLMLEKDFYDKYNFKVIISRPQSVFTKAYVVIDRNFEQQVLHSKYGKCFRFVQKGRFQEREPNGEVVSDTGDIFTLDLKAVWEEFYEDISFPQFKYWYFNDMSSSKNKITIMPEIRKHLGARQKVTIETRGDQALNEIRKDILSDFDYIADTLYSKFGKKYFAVDEFISVITEKYGKDHSRIIANTLFDLVDPNGKCVKIRRDDRSAKTKYFLSNGNFKERMRESIIKSSVVKKITNSEGNSYTSYINIANDKWSNIALKLLSVFNYISYEILGGQEPEIFIRLNDPQKFKDIALGNGYYSNQYVTQSGERHKRDEKVLIKFFVGLQSDQDRWDYIEDYFLGKDVLGEEDIPAES